MINGIFSSEGGKFFYNHLLCVITNLYISTKTSAGTRAASGRQRLAQNHAFIENRRVFFSAVERLHVGGIEGGGGTIPRPLAARQRRR